MLLQFHKTPVIYYSTIFDLQKDICCTIDYRAYSSSNPGGGILVGVIPFYRVAPEGYSGGPGLAYSNCPNLSTNITSQGVIGSVSALSANGIQDGLLGIAADFNGYFSSSETGVSSTQISPNTFAIRGKASDGYPLLYTSNNLSTFEVPFTLCDSVSSANQKSIRIRISDFGKRVYIDAKTDAMSEFTRYSEVVTSADLPDYVRLYFSFVVTTSTTHVSVNNININAFDTTLQYVYSGADYMGVTPNPATLSSTQTLSVVNTCVGNYGSLGDLILISNPQNGAPYIATDVCICVEYK